MSKQQNVRNKLESFNLPFEITQAMVSNVESFVLKEENFYGNTFSLSVHSPLLRRWDKRRQLLQRLRTAARLSIAEDFLYLAIIESAIEDLDYGCKGCTKWSPEDARADALVDSAKVFFGSEWFRTVCVIIDINPDWALELIEKYWLDIKNEYTPMRSVRYLTIWHGGEV